jgi:hypothetical protein
VHTTKNEDNAADLHTKNFHDLAGSTYRIEDPQSEDGIAKIDQVEAHEQQVIHRLRQVFIAVKNIDQKQLSVAEERMGYPEGEEDGNDEVQDVQDDNLFHDKFDFSEMWLLYCFWRTLRAGLFSPSLSLRYRAFHYYPLRGTGAACLSVRRTMVSHKIVFSGLFER